MTLPVQVVRVDYPLPNTGLQYSKREAGFGEKWWTRQYGTQSTTPEKGSTPGRQLDKAAPALPGRTLSRTLSRASSGAGEKVNARVNPRLAGTLGATQCSGADTLPEQV